MDNLNLSLLHLMPEAQDKVAIPLQSSYLCTDCEAIGNDSRQCVACGSTAILGLWRIVKPFGGSED